MMKINTKKFNQEMRKYAKKKKVGIFLVLRSVAMDMLSNLSDHAVANPLGTPADTSNARSNWRLLRESESRYVICNTTPYIRLLEFGGYKKGEKTTAGKSPWTKSYVSKQQPKGMVRRNIAAATDKIIKAMKTK